ncbi:MAG: HAMP domain-containing protein [Abitibacteriaceae bacterium]|nr:HAMP domain-containing protein [Abditibacteriaceae bacterium]
MRSLFLKIFLCFWAAQILIGAGLFALGLAMQRGGFDRFFYGAAGDSLEARAQAAAVAYEYGGQKALYEAWRFSLRPHPEGPEDRAGASLYAVDPLQPVAVPRLLVGPPAPDKAASLIPEAAHVGTASLAADDGDAWIARRIETRRGGYYVAMQSLRGPHDHNDPFHEWRHPHPDALLRLLVVALTLGAVCYGLALYLTAPAIKLRQATLELAAGNLAVRVGPQMGNRRDELADLGRDFDVMAERVESMLMSERRLLGDISHELRSPLARLQVALDLAMQTATGETVGFLERIDHEADSLNVLIGQLLTLTRLETAGAEARGEVVNLAHVVGEIASDADFEASGQDRGVRVVNLEECIIPGNANLLRSAVENVVRNAVRYTPPGKDVEISLRRESATEKPDEPERAVITVRDCGPGVPEEALTRLFDPFYRIEGARDRQSGGVGLGLSITERAVRLHGGKVRAVNAAGGGLLVEIQLPLAPPAF